MTIRFRPKSLGSQRGHGHFILFFAFVLVAIGAIGYSVYHHTKSLAVLRSGVLPISSQATGYAGTKTVLPASKEVTDHEFWKIVKTIKPQPAETVSRGTGVVTKASKIGAYTKTGKKLAKYGGKASGVLTAATILAFPDDLGAAPGEVTAPGASPYQYQQPAANSRMYSSKHSFNKDYFQYYVRVHIATGTRARPRISQSFGSPVKVKFSSEQRDETDGCGRNGDLGHRWRDSEAVINGRGWAYIPDCSKIDTFQASFFGLPKALENARVARSISTQNRGNIVNVDYFFDATTGSDGDLGIKLKPKTKPDPSLKTEEEKCNELLFDAIARPKTPNPAYGSGIGGRARTHGQGDARQIVITSIVANTTPLRKYRQAAKKISHDCEKQFDKYWNIIVVLDDKTDVNLHLRHKVKISLTSPQSGGGCKTLTGESSARTTRSQIFNECRPGPFTVRLSELGNYEIEKKSGSILGVSFDDIHPWKKVGPPKPGALPQISGDAGVRIRININLVERKDRAGATGSGAAGAKSKRSKSNKPPTLKHYSKPTKDYFADSAVHAWTRFQADYKGGGQQIALNSGKLKCRPSRVKISYRPFGNPNLPPAEHGSYNNLARASLGGAQKKGTKSSDYCRITFNSNQDGFVFTQNRQYACLLFMHAYGRLLGYANVNDTSRLMNDTINVGQAKTLVGSNECSGKAIP